MSCLLPNGTQRPVLDVKSPFLIYIWNVPDSLQPMEIKKIAQSHKFGRVRFVETFEAWRHEKIGQIIVEFQDGAGLDNFVDALSRQQVLRYDPPLEFMCLDPQLGSAHFFGQVKTWSGVDLLACNAIPPTFHYRTPMPPKVSSNRANSFALTNRRHTIGEGQSALAAAVGQRPSFPSSRRPYDGSVQRFDHGENSEADSTVRGLVEKDEQVPGGGAAAAIEWGGQGHTAAGRGTSFGRGTARASAFVDTIRENTINGHGSDYKTGGHTHDKPPANGGFGLGFGRGRGFAFGHGTLSTSNNHGNDQPSSLAPTFSGSGSLFVAPVFERRERRPLTIQQPPSAVEANDEDNVQEEKCLFSSPKNDNTFCIDVDDYDDLGLPLDANNDRDGNSTTNSSSPELRLETITTVILSGNPSPVSTCSPKEETTDEQTNEDRENFGGQQPEEGMEGAQPDEEEDKKVFYAQQTEEEARFQVQQKEKLERGQKLMRAVEEKMAKEAQLELMEEQERKAELAQMVEAAKRKAAEEEARKMGEYLADDAGKEEMRKAKEEKEEDITGLEDLQGNDEGNDNANGWSPPRWSAHSNATTAVMESKEPSKRSLEKEMNPDVLRSVNNLAPKLVEIKKECLEERIVEEKSTAEEELWKAHLALLADESKKKDQAGQKEVKEESQHETMQKPESKGNHTGSQNSTSSEQNNDTSSNSDAEDEVDHLARQIEQLFTKPFGERKRVHFIGVPTKDFSLAHVFAAAIVGHVLGNPERTFKLQSLDKKGSLIRVGPGLFDFQDGKSTFTSMQKVNLFTFDMAPSNLVDERLTVAGIAYAIYGKRAIAKILSGNDPDKFTRLLADPNTGKSKMAMIFCRIYRRFIQPMDQFFGHKQGEQPPSVTPEFELLRNFLADTIANASTGNLDEEQGLSCFHVAMFASMQFLAKLVQSLA